MTVFLYLLAGFLYILSFPGFNLSWLAWVCLIPLVIAIDRERDIWSVIRNCLLCGWLIFLGAMSWLINVTWLGYILVTFYMAWYMVLFGLVRFYNKNFITVPLAWTALEFIRSNLLGGIPWLLLGASQYSFLSLIQISNITGVYGVSFLVALVNIGILKYGQDGQGRSLTIQVSCILILLLVVGYGKYSLNRPTPRPRCYRGAPKIKIGIVQPNVPQDIKWDPKYTDWMLERLETLTKRIDDADLIIWPETVVPTLTETPGLLERIKRLNYNLILGSQGGHYYNSAFLILKGEGIVGEYRKVHLVPFGEYVPFGNVFPFLKKFTPIQDGFTAGREYAVFRISDFGFRISSLICFEDIFPDLVRRFVKKGADMLVNITNDGWFGETAAVYQHAYLSVFRAVENGVPLVRATNTGLSCFIDYTGKIYPLRPFVENSQAREILVPKRNTFYTKYGDVFSWVCVILLLTGGSYVRRIKKEPG